MFIDLCILQASSSAPWRPTWEAFAHFLQQRHLHPLHQLPATQPVVHCRLRRVEISGVLHDLGCLWSKGPKRRDRNWDEMQLHLLYQPRVLGVLLRFFCGGRVFRHAQIQSQKRRQSVCDRPVNIGWLGGCPPRNKKVDYHQLGPAASCSKIGDANFQKQKKSGILPTSGILPQSISGVAAFFELFQCNPVGSEKPGSGLFRTEPLLKGAKGSKFSVWEPEDASSIWTSLQEDTFLRRAIFGHWKKKTRNLTVQHEPQRSNLPLTNTVKKDRTVTTVTSTLTLSPVLNGQADLGFLGGAGRPKNQLFGPLYRRSSGWHDFLFLGTF